MALFRIENQGIFIKTDRVMAKLVPSLFWGNCGIILWLLGLLELIEMHTQCPLESLAFLGGNCGIFPWLPGLLVLIEMHTQYPLDSQASSIDCLGKLWDHSLDSWAA